MTDVQAQKKAKARKELAQVEEMVKELDERIQHAENTIVEAESLKDRSELAKNIMLESAKGMKLIIDGHWNNL